MRKKKRQSDSVKPTARAQQEMSGEQQNRKRRFSRLTVAAVMVAVLVIVGIAWWIPRLHIRRAEFAIRHWRFEKAKQHLLDYPVWGTDRGRVHYLLARVARQQDGYALAREHLRTAVAGGFDLKTVQRERDLLDVQNGDLRPELLRKFQLYLTQFPADRPAIYEAFALGNGGTGHAKTAAQILERWIQDYPRDGRPFYWKGFLDRQNGDEDSALAMYTESAKRDPQLADAHLGKARIQSKRSRDDSALAAYRDALEAAPERLDTRIAVAETLWLMRRQSDAVKLLKPITLQDPSIYPAGRKVAQYFNSNHQAAEAIAILKPMMKYFPDDASLNYLLADAYAQMSQTDRSTEAMKRFFIANATTDSLRYARSEVTEKRDTQRLFSVASSYRRYDWEKAKDWLEFSTKVLPGDPHLHQLRSELLLENGSVDEATRERNIAHTQSSQM